MSVRGMSASKSGLSELCGNSSTVEQAAPQPTKGGSTPTFPLHFVAIEKRKATDSDLIAVSGVQATRSGLTIQANLALADWKTLGEKLNKIAGAVQWWIGDWLNYGECTYGDRYTEALESTGYDYQSLANMKNVASSVQFYLRRENLSWSHHKEVAALPPDQQRRFLDWAENADASVRDLRAQIKSQSSPAPPLTTPLDAVWKSLSPLLGESADCPLNALPAALDWVKRNQPLSSEQSKTLSAIITTLQQLSELTSKHRDEFEELYAVTHEVSAA